MAAPASSKTILIASLAVLAVLALALAPRLMHMGPGENPEAAAAAAIGGPFTLVDSSGDTVTDEDFLGRYTLIYFGYAFCPDVCPTSLSAMAAALDMLPPEQAEKVVPIFITVDPERDTPDVLGGYVEMFHPRMVGLTGSEAQVTEAAQAYRVYYAKVEQEDGPYLMDHSSIVYFMGPDGKLRAHFSHNTDPDRMAEVMAEHL